MTDSKAGAALCSASPCSHAVSAFYMHDVPVTNGWPTSLGTRIYFDGPVPGAVALCHHHAYERGPAWGNACYARRIEESKR